MGNVELGASAWSSELLPLLFPGLCGSASLNFCSAKLVIFTPELEEALLPGWDLVLTVLGQGLKASAPVRTP